MLTRDEAMLHDQVKQAEGMGEYKKNGEGIKQVYEVKSKSLYDFVRLTTIGGAPLRGADHRSRTQRRVKIPCNTDPGPP